MEDIIQFLVYTVLVYLFIGMLFSFFFYFKGLNKIDDATKGSSFGFKLIVLPGVIIFWPFLLVKWIKQHKHESFTAD